MSNSFFWIVFYHQWKLSRKLRDLCFQIVGSLNPSGTTVPSLLATLLVQLCTFSHDCSLTLWKREGDFKSKRLSSIRFFIIPVLYRSLTFLIKRHVEKGEAERDNIDFWTLIWSDSLSVENGLWAFPIFLQSSRDDSGSYDVPWVMHAGKVSKPWWR
jgi:hypothetical protein